MQDHEQGPRLVPLAIIAAVFLGGMMLQNYLFPPPEPPAPAARSEQTPAEPGRDPAAMTGSAETPASTTDESAAKPAAAGTATETLAATPDAPVQVITVETPLYTTHISTRGAALNSLTLKGYLNDERTGPYEMVAGRFEGDPGAASLHVGNDLVRSAEHVFAYDGQLNVKLEDTEKRTVELRWSGNPGITWIKRFEFDANNYDIAVSHSVEGTAVDATSARLSLQTLATPPPPGERDASSGGAQAILSAQGKITRETPKDLFEDHETLTSDPFDGWAGLSLHYFLYAWITQSSTLATARIEAPAIDKIRLTIDFPERRIGGGSRQSLEEKFTLYMGPKKREKLEDAGNGLIASVDYGFFAPIAKLLLAVLVWLNRFINDYGWSIIVLTVIVRLLLFPLSVWQFKSMRAMQHIQPLVKEIREKYKADSQRQQQEMLNLYKQHKVNPFGGCLPMLAQIPIFLGLYMALLNAIELRHAAWAGMWITDLSLKDPYYVLPVLMTASTYFSMKLTPNPSADPTQQKIMQFMPLIFLFIFLKMPAGLMGYWTVSNLLSMGQQLYINRGAKAAEGVKHPTVTPETQPIDENGASGEESDSASRRRRERRKK